MRVLVGLVVALGLVVVPSAADARERRRPAKQQKSQKQTKKVQGKRAARISTLRERDRREVRELVRGQSIGVPWAGRLQYPTQLPSGETYHIRRPWRSFATQTTIELTERAIADTFEAFPDAHVLAIGDLSAETGGSISEHHSHQSGRDVDLGLFFLEPPPGYPASFMPADPDNLDCAATFKLIESFLASTSEDGGVQMIFLDFDVQGMLYEWALDQGVSERRLARIFQYPHGRGAREGLVRHEPNHDDHMHVRFQCTSDDTSCR
jgi:Penicillin-insensitive murein endopeptidase